MWPHMRGIMTNVDREKAMTELLKAVADASNEAREQRTLRMAAALYEASKLGIRQKDLVAKTGLTRETVRRHVEDEKHPPRRDRPDTALPGRAGTRRQACRRPRVLNPGRPVTPT